MPWATEFDTIIFETAVIEIRSNKGYGQDFKQKGKVSDRAL